MPTASTAGMLSLNNVGALTTTFTAPSSCSTAQGITTTGIAFPGLEGSLAYAAGNCEDSDFPVDCVPNREEVNEILTSLTGREIASVLNYYSPGLHCPDSWATVGVYAPAHHSNDSTTVSAADPGIFSPTAFNAGRPGESTSFPYADFHANMFTSALASTETAIVCCPSGFSAFPYGGCYSHFPVTSLAGETGCVLTRSATGISQEMQTYTYEFWGESTTVTINNLVFPTETDGESVSTITLIFDESGVPPETDAPIIARPTGDNQTELRGIAVVMPLYLVHSGERDGSNDQGGDGNDDDEEEGDDEGGNGENAARGLSPVADWRPIAGVLGAWVVSVAAGLGLLAGW